jgi:hypothetical protein
MDLPSIILISLVLGLKRNIDIKQRKLNFKSLLKEFFSIGILLLVFAFIMDRYLPKREVSWIFVGIILLVAIYLTIRTFIQLKKK